MRRTWPRRRGNSHRHGDLSWRQEHGTLPGLLARAATASCVATLIVMKAALEKVELEALEVTVDSESDDLGILGINDETPAGPLSVSVRVSLGSTEGDVEKLREIVESADTHCPVTDLTRRQVPISLRITS